MNFHFAFRFGDSGICECLFDYMSAWQDNVDMVTVLLIAAQNLALTALNRYRLGRAGVCKLIMTVVNRYKSNESVLEYGFMAIQKLALEEENGLAMHDMKVSSLLVKSIRGFMFNESVVELGSMAIMNLSACAGDNIVIIQSLEAAGVAECITTVLHKFTSQSDIVEYCLIAICNLAAGSENLRIYGLTGIADILTAIIKKYRQNEAILEQICKVIVSLIKNKENIAQFQQSNIQTILSKTLVTLSRNKTRTMMERTKQMVKTGILTPLTSSSNQLLNKSSSNNGLSPQPPPISAQNGSSTSGSGSRQGPIRLERSSSSSVSSLQSYSTFSSMPLTTPDGSISTSLNTRSGHHQSRQHAMTVDEVMSKIKNGIKNIEEVTTATCLRNIARMCEGNPATQAEFGSNGACKVVMEALSTFLNSRHVAENGLRAVCYLSRFGQDKSTANAKNNETFGQIQLPHMLVKAMQFHEDSEKVSLYGCKAIMNLGSFEANNDMLGDAGACEVVVSVLTKFTAIGVVLKQGLWAMINLSLDKKNNARFTSSGCARVVQILREHANEPDIAAWACMGVQNLCINKENQVQLGSMEAVEMVVKTMEANLTDTMTIQFGLMAIEKLAQCPENSRRAGACTACELVLRSLQMFHGNLMIIELCWKCMNRLCNQSLENCYRFVDNNVCVLLTSSLKKFSKTEEIVEQVLAAIGYLGGTPVKPVEEGTDSTVQHVRSILGNSGVCEAVTLILTTYTSDEAIKKASQQQSDNIGIIFLCLQAIASLSINEEDNRSRFGACGTCEKTIAAMTLHLGSEDIAIRGATVVLALAKHHPSNAMKFTATGALTVMLRIIQKNSSNMNVVVMGFSAMATVLNATSGEKDCGSGSQTERATVTFSSNTKDDIDSSVSGGASTRPTMRRDRRATAVGVWEDAGSYDVILKIMRLHMNNKEISGCGCQLLHSMMYVCASSLMNTSASGSVGNGRGVNLPPKTISNIGDTLMTLLATYNTTSSRVVSSACQTISDMLADPRTGPKICVLLGKLGLCESLLTSLDYHIAHPTKHIALVDKILIALAGLCADSNNSALCGRKGLCEKVVKLILSQLENDCLVLCACRVLAALANNSENQKALIDCSAGTVAMTVLEKYKSVGSIVAQVCLTIGAFVQHPTSLKQLKNVHQLLVSVLESHFHHASVTQEATQAILNLTQLDAENCDLLLSVGATGILFKILTNHSSFFRPQTTVNTCQIFHYLCQSNKNVAVDLCNGMPSVGRSGSKDIKNAGISFILTEILNNIDEYSPKTCNSSSTNRDLHEKVPFSSALKRKQNISLISAVLTLLHCLVEQFPGVISDLFPGKSEVAPWVTVTTSLKQIYNTTNNHNQVDFLKLLACDIMKQYMNDSSVVLLVVQIICLSFQQCPEAKRCFALREKIYDSNVDEMWICAVSEVMKVYLTTKKIYLVAVRIMVTLLESVARSVVIHNSFLLAYLEIENFVGNVVAGLTTYLTDTPVLLQLTSLVYHISRIGQFSSSHLMLKSDLESQHAAEKLLRVLQVHQHDDEEHTSSSRSTLTETETMAVQLCVTCCEALGSICEHSDVMTSLIGVNFGFCELASNLLGNALTKSKSEKGKSAGGDIYIELLDVTCSAISTLLATEDNKRIAEKQNLLHILAALLITHYEVESLASSCCTAITYLITPSTDKSNIEGHSTLSAVEDISTVCSGIMLALKHHLKSESMVRTACWTVSQLATEPNTKRILGRHGAGNLVVQVLENHHSNMEVLELILGAVVNLADHDAANTISLYEANVIPQFVKLFESFSGLQRDQHYILCELLCMATINLTEASTLYDENCRIITAFGLTSIFKSVLAMVAKVPAPPPTSIRSPHLTTHVSSSTDNMSTTLMKQGCWVLKNLALQHPANSAMLGEMGACEILIPTMNTYIQKDPEVAEVACAVLASLLTVDMANFAAGLSNEKTCGTDNITRLTEAGGFDVSIQTLFAFTGSSHTSAIRMACFLLHRFLFLTVVNTDHRASVSAIASDYDRDYHIEDDQIQSALDSFATIQHVMEEALHRHASQDIEIANRTIRVLRHLYFRTFRASPRQYRVFTTLSMEGFDARVMRGNLASDIAYSTKLPLDDADLQDHHRRLVLSDWRELSFYLGPLIVQYKDTVSMIHQLLSFATELCDSAAQGDMQTSLGAHGLIQNILSVLKYYLESTKRLGSCDVANLEEKDSYLIAFEGCGRCLVAMLENHDDNKHRFLEAGGGQVLADLLDHLLIQPVSTTQRVADYTEKEGAVILTSVSRMLLVLLLTDDPFQQDQESGNTSNPHQCRDLLHELDIPKSLIKLCLSRDVKTLPLSSRTIFLSRQLSCNEGFSSSSGDRNMTYASTFDSECEVGSVFAPCFHFPTGTEADGGRVSAVSLDNSSEERVDDETERIGVSSILACIHSLDVLHLFAFEGKVAWESITSASSRSDRNGDFCTLLITKANEMCSSENAKPFVASPIQLPMSETYASHLTFTYVLASRELLSQHLINFLDSVKSSVLSIKSNPLAPLVSLTFQLLGQGSSSEIWASQAAVMLVQIVSAISISSGKMIRGIVEEGHDLLVPLPSDEDESWIARRDVLHELIPSTTAAPVIATLVAHLSTASDVHLNATLRASTLSELNRYLR